MNKKNNANLHKRAVSQVKNLTENNLEDVTQNDNDLRLWAKATNSRTYDLLSKVNDMLNNFLIDYRYDAKTDYEKSLVRSINFLNYKIKDTLFIVESEYTRLFSKEESELN